MPDRPWSHDELEELAREHIEYDVRKLVEFAEALRRLPTPWEESGRGAEGQALLDALLLRLRILGTFLGAPRDRRDVYARDFCPSWTEESFLSSETSARVSAKVAHLGRARLRRTTPDVQPGEALELACS
ncbi:MAG: hypothetical protein RMM28_04520 [Thermoleophilia bacterium]|nr:hypothetical protein [Gaiellaceae bacterium]MDW8338387.1 hypothetical protein [Thermoleophilia bacterium]